LEIGPIYNFSSLENTDPNNEMLLTASPQNDEDASVQMSLGLLHLQPQEFALRETPVTNYHIDPVEGVRRIQGVELQAMNDLYVVGQGVGAMIKCFTEANPNPGETLYWTAEDHGNGEMMLLCTTNDTAIGWVEVIGDPPNQNAMLNSTKTGGPKQKWKFTKAGSGLERT